MNLVTKMKQNYEKFKHRGAIKEIMKNYGLRTISLKNYFDYLGVNPTIENVHSIKYDIMNGYINVYKYKPNDALRRCGDAFDTVSNTMYKDIHDIIETILNTEHTIPYKKKKNIMVKVNR